jgi:hypothetical protein
MLIAGRGSIASNEGYHFGGCFFTASSLMSAPQPGLVGMCAAAR